MPTGYQILNERDRRHLTQAEAAEQAGVSLRTWQNWEARGAARIEARPRLRRALVAWLDRAGATA